MGNAVRAGSGAGAETPVGEAARAVGAGGYSDGVDDAAILNGVHVKDLDHVGRLRVTCAVRLASDSAEADDEYSEDDYGRREKGDKDNDAHEGKWRKRWRGVGGGKERQGDGE